MGSMNFNSVGPVAMEGISAVTATPSQSLGEIRIFNSEAYVYAYNAGGSDAYPKAGMKYVTGASGYSVANTSLSDTFNPLAGVVKHATIPAASYGWILQRGFTSVVVVSASTADYKMIALGIDGKFIEASGTTTAGTGHCVGFALSHNTGAGGTVYAHIAAFGV